MKKQFNIKVTIAMSKWKRVRTFKLSTNKCLFFFQCVIKSASNAMPKRNVIHWFGAPTDKAKTKTDSITYSTHFQRRFDKRHFVFSVPFWNCAANFTQLKGRNGFYLPDTNTQVTITIKSLKMNQMLAPNVVEPSQKQRKTPESLGDCWTTKIKWNKKSKHKILSKLVENDEVKRRG